MSTRFGGQLNPNEAVKDARSSPSHDIWTNHTAVIGDWGLGFTDLWQRIIQRHEQVLQTGSVATNLWQMLKFGRMCSCLKPESGQTPARCPICYGTQLVGGYERFGYQTLVIDAALPGLQATGGAIILAKTPTVVELQKDAQEGQIITPVFQISDNLGFNASKLDAFNWARDIGQENFTVEYSPDGGETFFPLSDSQNLNERVFNLQLRVTIKRNNTASPVFTALRIRFQNKSTTNILISKKSFPEQHWLESFGIRLKLDGVTWWTTPSMGLNDGSSTFIEEEDIFEVLQGRYTAQDMEKFEFPISGRMKPANVTYVEPMSRFISQRFNVRALQRDEPSNSVF